MTTEQYLEAITTEYYNGSAWVDITAYVVGDIKGGNGLGGWKPENRVAVLGTLNITLNNKSKFFSPMGNDVARGLSTLAGFTRGAKIRITGTFRGQTEVIWIGRIMSIDSDDLNWGNEQARLMAVDYMNVPVDFPMKGATIALNQRIDEALTLILARLSLQPEATDFDTGLFTFPAVFDNVQRKTMALSEFTKLANSELGYIYVKQDGTLVAENMTARQGWRAVDTITIPELWIVSTDIEFLLLEDGDFLLQEDGYKLLLDDGTLDPEVTEAPWIFFDAENYNILMSEDSLLNASIIRAHPVITDTSLKVLYKLGTPLFVPSGQTVQFSAHYTDPSGLNQVSGTNMQAVTATTDFLANSAADGSGTNYTADVDVFVTYYGDIAFYSIVNNATSGVYMTLLQARGYGIYYANSIESSKEDTDSQDLYGYAPFQLDMKYQKDTYLADMFGLSVIEEYREPKSRITKIKYLANLNKNHMMSFLMLSIGSLILGQEDRSGLNNNYYITDRAFTIKQGGIVNVEYGVKQSDSYLSAGLLPLTVEFNYGSTDAINYGVIPSAFSNNTGDSISVSAWIYANTLPPTDPYYIFAFSANSGGFRVYLDPTSGEVGVYSNLFATAPGTWRTTTGTVIAGRWTHITVTFDMSSASNDPIIYVDGTSRAITETATPSGAAYSRDGVPIMIGNIKTATEDYDRPFDGKIFDPRVYGRILTLAEAQTLYNIRVPLETLVTDGLVFQGLATYSDRPFTAGTVLSSTDKLVENILRAVGIPNGSPTIRANP